MRRVGSLLAAAMVGLAVLSYGVFVAQAANTTNNYIGGGTGSLLTGSNWSLGHIPNVGEDAVFTSTTGIRSLTAGSLTVGSFNVTAGSGTFSIRNNTSTATNSTLTLGGSGSTGDGVSGDGGDLLYAASGSVFNLIGPNGGSGTGVLNVVLGQSGNFNSAGTVNVSSAVSGGGFGITKTGAGTLTLSGANTYTGDTTVGAGTLALSGSGSIDNSPNIAVAGGATFDVQNLTAGLTLAGGQGLKATGTTSTGTIATASGKGLTTASNSPLQFTAFNGSTAPLTISGAGTITLAAGNPVTVNTTTPLGAGDYTLIAKGASGAVAGAAPTSLNVGGSGLAGGMAASLRISESQLVLHVAPAGTLQFSSATYSAGEGGGFVTLSVTRTGGSQGAAAVSYATSDGTAASPGDYTGDAGTLSWADGDSAPKSVSVFVANDNVYEGDETFGVTLSAPSGATLGAPSAATVTVNDNDSAPSVSAGDVTVAEPSSGITYALFPVTLSNPSAFATTVSYATADGTAVAPDDYSAASGTVSFAAGETAKTVAVIVKADSFLDANEKFKLNLSGPGGGTVADGTGEATITAPVAPGSIIISEFRLGGPNGSNDEFVELYNNTDEDITVTDDNPVSCALQLTILDATQRCGWALMDVQGQLFSTPRYVVPTLRTDVIPAQPNVIPARGHLLLAGSGYSLSALAAPDFNYPTPAYADSDFNGLALYRTADREKLATSVPLDAVGFDGVALPYREGSGLLPSNGVEPYTGTTYAQHSFVRNQPSSRPTDTGDNRADFTLVATDPAQVTTGVAVLGAPAPENRASLVSRNSQFGISSVPNVAASLRTTSPAVPNGSLGTLSVRRRFTNNTGAPVSRLRLRVVQVTTWNSKQVFASQADVRLLDAQLTGLPSSFKAATVETPPAQPNGGGVNTGLLLGGSLVLAQPLSNGQSVDVEFLFGVMKGGTYSFVLVVEAGQ